MFVDLFFVWRLDQTWDILEEIMKRSRLFVGIVIICVSFLLVASSYYDTSYVVKPGDTLSSIARAFNTTVPAIISANNITNPNLIYAGQTLIIPTGDGGSPPEQPPPPAPPPRTPSTDTATAYSADSARRSDEPGTRRRLCARTLRSGFRP